MTTTPLLGFRLHYFRDLEELRSVTFDSTVPMDRQDSCPACNQPLETLVTFIARDNANRLRLGWCTACGYRGYIDRPSVFWFTDFYRERWDNAEVRNARTEAKRTKPWLSRAQRASVAFAVRLAPDRSRPVVEIGCGFGSSLKEFETHGFNRVIGVEPSRFRGEVTRAVYGHRVLTGFFEDEAVQAPLRREAPVGMFYSFHALEHAYHPAAVIAAAATLQEEGDMFILAVPNAENEPPVNTLFWLPHLHAFTERALTELFHRNGYEIAAVENVHPSHLIFAARRKKHVSPLPPPMRPANPVPSIREYFRIERLLPGRRYRLTWKKKTDRSAFGSAPLSRVADRLLQAGERVRNVLAAHLLGRFYASRSLVMSSLERRITDPGDLSVEVQYDGPIELLVR